MDLRAPLPPEHSYHHRPIRTVTREILHVVVPAILSRTYVASRTMQLGTEARFTSIVVFHRYVSHFLNSYDDATTTTTPASCTAASNTTNGSTEEGEEFGEMRRHLGRVAAACLFLGCKAQETPRRIRDVINIFHMFDFTLDRSYSIEEAAASGGKKRRMKSDDNDNDNGGRKRSRDGTGNTNTNDISPKTHKFRTDSHDGADKKKLIRVRAMDIRESDEPPDLDESYWKFKEKIVSTEQSILRMLTFDVSVCQPHRLLVILYEDLISNRTGGEVWFFGGGSSAVNDEKCGEDDPRGEESEEKILVLRKMVLKYAWKRLNDAMFHLPALRCGCMELACAALDLALDEGRRRRGEASDDIDDDDVREERLGWMDSVGVNGVTKADVEHAKKMLVDASESLLNI